MHTYYKGMHTNGLKYYVVISNAILKYIIKNI